LNDLNDSTPELIYSGSNFFARHSFLFKFRLSQLIGYQLYRLGIIDPEPKPGYSKVKSIKNLAQNKYYADLISEDEETIFKNIAKIKEYFPLIEKSKKPFQARNFLHLGRVGILRHALNELHEMSQVYNFKVIILIIPNLENIKGIYVMQPVHNIVTYEAKRHDFSVTDMYDIFSQYGFDKLKLSKRDIYHTNIIGHKLIAEQLYDVLRPLVNSATTTEYTTPITH